MLIFDENKQYENLMNNGFAKFPNRRDLKILCKRWMADGVPFSGLKDNMIDFCTRFNSQFNYAKSEAMIVDVLNSLKEKTETTTSFEFCTNIVIFEEEIKKILEIKDKNQQKLLFVMISLAKWRNTNYIYLNSEGSIRLKDIFSLAGIVCTKKEQSMYLYGLNKAGYIDVQLRPLLKVVIPCTNQEGNKALSFTINDDMVEEWNKLVLPHCSRCDKPFERHSSTQKYCKDCHDEIEREHKRNYIHKIRGV